MVFEGTGLEKYIPSGDAASSFALSTVSIITIFVVIVLIMIIIGIAIYFILREFKFNKKIEIFAKRGNTWEKIGKDKGMVLKYGSAGDSILYLRKNKKYLPLPEIQVGKNLYWFAIREDNEWINIGMEDIDLLMRKAKAKFLHKEMRYARTAIQRNLKDRFDKPKFFEKYGSMIINLVAIVIILVFMWMIIDKIVSVADKVNIMAQTGNQVMEKANEVLAGLDRVCSGSGMKV